MKKAADGANFTEARYWQGRAFLDDRNPMYNFALGSKALSVAADKRHAHAALIVGQYYAEGVKVRKHMKLARQYLNIASQGGLENANVMLDNFK